MPERPIIIATRGSALAQAQAHLILAQCRAAFPRLQFEIKIIKTTGDKKLSASLAHPDKSLPKGLFTKELEVALLKHRADLAVHSLKDLPTDLPDGLKLGAVSKRADVRDVLIYRDAEYLKQAELDANAEEWIPGQSQRRGFSSKLKLTDLPDGATVATSSNRRKLQMLQLHPKLNIVEIRGNVVTRLNKLAEQAELDATILAAAGFERLNFRIDADGRLTGDAVPDGLFATVLGTDIMLPCVGQAALGIEVREHDERIEAICQRLNHYNTHQCVLAERALLRGMGGGCQTPLGAHAEASGEKLHLRAVSFVGSQARRHEAKGSIKEPEALGDQVADALKSAIPEQAQ